MGMKATLRADMHSILETGENPRQLAQWMKEFEKKLKVPSGFDKGPDGNYRKKDGKLVFVLFARPVEYNGHPMAQGKLELHREMPDGRVNIQTVAGPSVGSDYDSVVGGLRKELKGSPWAKVVAASGS